MQALRGRVAIAAVFFFAVCAIQLFGTSGSKADEAPFYQGKTIRIIVGGGAGGFNDSWARLLARHMGKYIPGNPDFIVQNIPGAGSIIATNHVYNVLKPDGLAILMPLGTIYMPQILGVDQVHFDVRKMNWLGTQEQLFQILYMRADTPYEDIEAIINAKEPPKCGSTGATSAGSIVPKILDLTTGAKFKIVSGYGGGPAVDLAVQRNEVVCRAMTGSSHFGRQPFLTWHEEGFDRHIVQTGRRRDPNARDTPTIFELMDRYETPETTRGVVELLVADGQFGRPFAVAPSVPEERVEILRNAYAKALQDPELLAEAKKRKMSVEPTPGKELQAFATRIVDQPEEVVEQAREILGMSR